MLAEKKFESIEARANFLFGTVSASVACAVVVVVVEAAVGVAAVSASFSDSILKAGRLFARADRDENELDDESDENVSSIDVIAG